MTRPDILAEVLDSCDRRPESPAISFGRMTLTYRQLGERILEVAAALSGRGLMAGDRVLFSVRPGLEGVCLALGIIAARGTVVFADPGAGESMFRARAELAGPRWVAAESLLYLASSPLLRPVARRRGLELPAYGSVVPTATHIYTGRRLPGVPRGALPYASLTSPGGTAPLRDRAADEDALIIFTSGTTDDPKAVVHSRASLGAGLRDFAGHIEIPPGARVLTDQLMVGVPALIAGAHWIIPPHGANPGAKPAQYLELLPGADVLFAVPAALDALLRMLEDAASQRPKLTTLLVGGAPVLRPLLERARAQLPGTRIIAIYGMTEILPVAMADADEKVAFTGAGDFAGQLMSAVDARIDDGELVVAGEGLAPRYLGQLPMTELRTGDLARIEEERLILTGRSKDMFIRGTTNVYPGLYEPVIAGLPGVSEAAMLGLPDEMGNDSLVLVVVPGEPPSGFTTDHPVIAPVARTLPGLIDAGALPDVILAAASLPKSGRSGKLDRGVLERQVRQFLG